MKTRLITGCLLLFILAAPTAPVTLYAQNGVTRAIIPCGNEKDATGASLPRAAESCDFQGFIALINNVMNFMVLASIPISVLAFASIGIMYLFAQGDVAKRTRAKGIAWNVLLGFIFIICAWALVRFVTGILLKPEYNIFLDKTNLTL